MNRFNPTTQPETIAMIKQLDQVLYTANTHATGGRDGAGKTSDGTPVELTII
jgi:hypothetical protein